MELHVAGWEPAARSGQLPELICLSASRSLRMLSNGSCMIIELLDVVPGHAGSSAAIAKIIHE